MLKSLALLTILLCNGCTLIGQPIADELARAIDRYCQTEGFEARRWYNQAVNRALGEDGHYIALQCAQDPSGVTPESRLF